MSAYVVVQETVSDEERYVLYRKAVGPLIRQHGGKAIARSPRVGVLEGKPEHEFAVIIEFPSIEAIHIFWNSAEYAAIRPLRKDIAQLTIWTVDGV